MQPTPRPISDAAAWCIALVPLVALVVGYLADQVSESAGNGVTIGATVATIFVIRQDRAELLAAGAGQAPSMWWFLLPPVYLWKRANLLGRDKGPFWTCIAIYVVAVVVAVVAATVLMSAEEL